MRTVSEPGLDLIKHFESCLKSIGGGKYKAYKDPVGVLTIGWGHTNHHGRRFDASSVWSKGECDAELATDLAIFEKRVTDLVKVPLKQYQFDALVSFDYNTGGLGKSTLLKKLNAHDYDGAANEFKRWNKGGGKVLAGLTRRRNAEEEMFRGKDWTKFKA